MSTAEIKLEIQQVLDRVPEDALVYILNQVKEIEANTADRSKLEKNIDKIFSENKGLLERLAQ
ncbi:hypothetical protein [uncultured Mucilaginibacter sp.]|uniref:hypothetical protein n=1 Tax=uncultured Mucilaginibacter sp. TaxID=797541 RepID=UPI0025FD1E77|nr:hypothetical protein [uncultured Mucilaginibacter sp.]